LAEFAPVCACTRRSRNPIYRTTETLDAIACANLAASFSDNTTQTHTNQYFLQDTAENGGKHPAAC